jgi:hypothetical protein
VACTDAGGGATTVAVGGKSTEANSALNGNTLTQDNNAVTGDSFTAFRFNTNENVSFAAPSGATLNLVVQYGIKGLGTDCFFAADGFVSP